MGVIGYDRHLALDFGITWGSMAYERHMALYSGIVGVAWANGWSKLARLIGFGIGSMQEYSFFLNYFPIWKFYIFFSNFFTQFFYYLSR